MNKNESLELAHWAVKVAQKNGADQVAVDISKSRDISVSFHERKPETLTESTKNGLSLRIFAANRYSSHSTCNFKKDALEKFIGEAVAMTRYLGEDKFRTLPDPKYYQGIKDVDLKISDPDYDKVTSQKRVELAGKLEELTLSKSDEIVSCSTEYGDNKTFQIKLNSNGFEGYHEETDFYYYTSTTFIDEKGGRPSDYDYSEAKYFRDLAPLEQLAQNAIERTRRRIGQVKMASGRYDMIVENRAASRILSPLVSAMQGRALQQKNSFLLDKLGQKIACDKLTLIDDPFVPGGMASGLYDSEGMANQRRVIIDKGVLQTYYIDTYYANKMGVEPTGGSRTNVIVEPGEKSLEELVAQCKKGILVTSFVGGNVNDTTGDFSTGIIGMYVENGKIIKPVNEMNITGNHTEIWNRLVELGNDVYTISAWRRPSLYFEGIEFSGL
jgi:PmbA protein